MGEEMDNFEIMDTENYSAGGSQDYSRSMLLMRATGKVLEAGSREMKPGFYMEKKDKFGNTIKMLTDDTRKAYIEAVKTLRDLSTCDFDKKFKEMIEKIEKEIEDKRKELLEEEEKEFSNLKKGYRDTWNRNGFGVTKGSFNSNKRFYEQFILFNLEKSRKLFQVLVAHAKDVDFYKEEMFEG